MGRKYNDISGNKYGNLSVTNELKHTKKCVLWKCVCNNCGTVCYVSSSDLKRGRTNYCPKCNQEKSEISILKVLYKNYRLGAKKRNIEFELSLDEFKKIINMPCNYCNISPKQILHKKDMKYDLKYNGIDRVNNDLGYTVNNCVAACKFCNLAKRNFKREDFIDWIGRIKQIQD